MNRDDAMARAISHAEAAQRLLAVDDALAGSTPGSPGGTAEEGPPGVYEEQRAARHTGATAHAMVAQAWATIGAQLGTKGAEELQAMRDRRRDDSERRSRT